MHPPPPAHFPQEATATHEDDVTHQPERGHAPPPPRHRDPNAGEERTVVTGDLSIVGQWMSGPFPAITSKLDNIFP